MSVQQQIELDFNGTAHMMGIFINVLESFNTQFETLNNEISKLGSKLDAKNSTITFDGFRQPRTVPNSVDIKTFTKLINAQYNRKFGRNIMYQMLRDIGLIEKDSTKPTLRAIDDRLLGREHYTIEYDDGTTGQALRTVVLTGAIPQIAERLRMQMYL